MEELIKLKNVKAGTKGGITASCRNLKQFMTKATRSEIRAKRNQIIALRDRINVLNERIYDLVKPEEIEALVLKDGEYEEIIQQYL